MVVRHQAGRHHEVGRDEAGELACATRGEQPALGDVRAPEQRKRHQRQHQQLRAASRDQRHAQRSRKIPLLGSRRSAPLHPEVQTPHRERQAQCDGQRVERRELQQVQHAAAHDQRYLQQQVQPQAHPFEVVAREPVQQRRASQHERHDGDQHADGRGEIRARQQVERQVEQYDRHHAEVHVVVPVIIRHVEKIGLSRLLLHLVARALVVGVVGVLQPLRRLLLQVQLAVSHGLRQFRVLLRVVTAHLEYVDQALAVPRAAVVALRGHAHEIRSQEQERAQQTHLDSHRCDDGGLRLARLADDADAVDGRARTERERQRQQAHADEEARRVEVERVMRVEDDVAQLDGIAHVVARDLDTQVLHEARRVEVDVLALIAERGHPHRWHAYRVLRGVEVRMVRVVSELDLHRQILRRLPVVEVQPDVVHLGVEVRELQHVVHRGHLVLVVNGLLQGELVVQRDGVVVRRREVVDVEQERLEQKRDQYDGKRALDQVNRRQAVPAHEAVVGIGYVLAYGRHIGMEL